MKNITGRLQKVFLQLILIIFIFIVAGTFLVPQEAFALGPFGGAILTIYPCINGLKITLSTPTPGFYFYPWGALSFLFGPPTHPGQWLLGMSGPPMACLTACEDGQCASPGGSVIIFHGSSI